MEEIENLISYAYSGNQEAMLEIETGFPGLLEDYGPYLKDISPEDIDSLRQKEDDAKIPIDDPKLLTLEILFSQYDDGKQ